MVRRLEGNCSLLAPGVVAPKMECDGELKRRGRWWRERDGGRAGKEGSLLLLTLNWIWVRPGWMGWDNNYRICVYVHDEGADGEC